MKFYVLENPKVARGDAVTDYLPVEGSRVGDAPRCPICGKPLGMLPLLPPVRIELEAWRSRWGDIAFGPGDQILVSARLKALFIEGGLTGFTKFDPVEIIRVKRRNSSVGKPPEYLLASIQRSHAALDEVASGLVRDAPPTCEECRISGIRRADRIVLEAGTWSGEDVFFARGLPGMILVSERFRGLCDDNDVANTHLVDAHNFAFDFYPQDRSAHSKLM